VFQGPKKPGSVLFQRLPALELSLWLKAAGIFGMVVRLVAKGEVLMVSMRLPWWQVVQLAAVVLVKAASYTPLSFKYRMPWTCFSP
jgi:hypothetical protein